MAGVERYVIEAILQEGTSPSALARNSTFDSVHSRPTVRNDSRAILGEAPT
jgi:hypothetical protein